MVFNRVQHQTLQLRRTGHEFAKHLFSRRRHVQQHALGVCLAHDIHIGAIPQDLTHEVNTGHAAQQPPQLQTQGRGHGGQKHPHQMTIMRRCGQHDP
jgi:hypothetical protein